MAKRQAKRKPPSFTRAGRGSITAATVLADDAAVLFEGVAQEILHGERALFDTLTAHERRILVDWLSSAVVDGDAENAIHDVLWEVDYVRKPVGIEEFIHDDFYFGQIAGDLHSKWKEDLYRVFDPNSGIFEWVMCLSGDTAVPLLNGASKTLEEMHAEFEENGASTWVYSINSDTGEVVPGEATRVTKFAVDDLFRVTFDDGSSVRANASHEFVCRDGVKRRLCDLKVDDRLMPFLTRHQRQKGQRLHKGYEQVYLPGPQKYAYTHRVVGRDLAGGTCPKSVDGDRAVLHHVDFDCGNNEPLNLRWMGWQAHRELHRRAPCLRSDSWRQAVSKRQRAVALDPQSPLRRGHRAFMRSEEGRKLAASNLSKAIITAEERRERGRNGSRARWSNPEERGRASERCRARSEGNKWGRLSSRVRRDLTVERIYVAFDAVGTLSATYARLGVSRNAVVRTLRDAGLTLDDLRQGYRNHRIVSIEPDGRGSVYCLTVPRWGNFAISTDSDNRRGIFSGNTGAIGIGKTTLASVGLAYKLYCMSCLRDPAAYYGLLPGSQVIFGVYSITKRQVADTGYHNIRGYIDACPYFRQQFPRSTKIDSLIDFEPRTKKKLKVIPGSTELHALGLNLFAFLMDEVNFMRVKDNKEQGVFTGQAYDLYNATYTRLLSRFTRPGGTLPGMMFLLSSRNAQTSFLEEHLRNVRSSEHSVRTHISDYPLWVVKNKRFTWPGFRVEVGDRVSKSRMLKDGEEPRKDATIVEVPWEYHKPFTEDIDQALRDIAGVATFNLSPLISDRQSVFDAVSDSLVHPFSRVEVMVDIADDVRIEDFFLKRAVCRIKESKWVPRLNPKCPRFAHVDIGLTGDALGLAMGHVAGLVKNERVDVEGVVSTVVNPYVVIDLMLRVVCPPGGEVDLAKVRAFIQFLRRIFPIQRVTFDQYQSKDSIQILKKLGFEAGHQSLDRTDEGYLALRSALFDRRISMYEYGVFQDEALDLERHVKVGKVGKVDHPTQASKGGRGSKDVSDAVAGVVWLCLNDDRALHKTVADVEIDLTDRQSVAERRVASDTTIVAPDRRVGAARTTWDELRANV